MSESERRDAFSSSMAAGPSTPLWDVGALMQLQARLWNQWIDSQRNLWAIYMPWLQGSPWLQAGAQALEIDESGKEAAETVDGIPDALELQARSWNQFLDANRSFWSTVMWPGPMDALQGVATAASGADAREADQRAASRPEARDSSEARPARRAASRKRA